MEFWGKDKGNYARTSRGPHFLNTYCIDTEFSGELLPGCPLVAHSSVSQITGNVQILLSQGERRGGDEQETENAAKRSVL